MTLQSTGAGVAGDAELRGLAPWFHNLHLPDGRQTAPDHPLGDFPAFKWEQIAPSLPADMRGMRALDIGCNAGFYSIALANRGAQVLGIDVDPHYLRQAEWARERFGLERSRLSLAQMQVYDLARLPETFDVVLFLGVLYHLRHPLLALDILHEHVVTDMFVFQSMLRGSIETRAIARDYEFWERDQFDAPGYPLMYFVEHKYAHDPTNWWIPNRACAEAMLRSSGFEILDHPEAEVFICRRRDTVHRTQQELPPWSKR
jgi:tRNA (mo5U34)-methyltransferase